MAPFKTAKKTGLFLHMGPGYHSQVEAECLQSECPHIDFWDQPKAGSFDELVDKAVEKVGQLYEEADKRILIVAHSFGAQLALALAKTMPLQIKKINIVNGAVDPFECFMNLAPHLKVPTPFELSMEELRKADADTKMKFIFHIAPYVEPGKYWHNQKKFEEFLPIIGHHAPLDLSSFVILFTDFLKQRKIQNGPVWDGPVKVYTGAKDLLIDYKQNMMPWHFAFPKAKFASLKEVGHFPYFENPAYVKEIFS